MAAINTYILGLGLYWLWRGLGVNPFGLTLLLTTLLHGVLLPAIILLPLLLWSRRWLMAGLLGLNVVAFGGAFGHLFLPQTHASSDSATLRVMTYNVAHSLTPPETLVTALRTSGADIIALQELVQPQARAIEQNLSDLYPYQALYGYGIPGKGLLSRYPILEEELFYLSTK